MAGRAEAARAACVLTGVLLDEMYPPWLGQKLRAAGHDVVAALDIEVGLRSRSDPDVLAWATRTDRCVVTENVRDFAQLASAMSHAGMIFVSVHRFPGTGSGLARIETALDELLRAGRLPPPGGVFWLGAGS